VDDLGIVGETMAIRRQIGLVSEYDHLFVVSLEVMCKKITWETLPAELASLTFLKCFFINIEPFKVHLPVFFFWLLPQLVVEPGGCLFSFTQISISEKRKHSSSCHD